MSSTAIMKVTVPFLIQIISSSAFVNRIGIYSTILNSFTPVKKPKVLISSLNSVLFLIFIANIVPLAAITIFFTLFIFYMYALVTDWKLNLGLVSFETCEPYSQTRPSKYLSQTPYAFSLVWGAPQCDLSSLWCFLHHFTPIASKFICTTYVKLMHLPSKSSSAPGSYSAPISSSISNLLLLHHLFCLLDPSSKLPDFDSFDFGLSSDPRERLYPRDPPNLLDHVLTHNGFVLIKSILD